MSRTLTICPISYFFNNCTYAHLLNCFADVWQKQCWDGFHFDRYKVNTREEHEQNIIKILAKGQTKPGQLEIQLAQSALHTVFYDVLQHLSHSKELKIQQQHKATVIATTPVTAPGA
jgi:hypothetical protein